MNAHGTQLLEVGSSLTTANPKRAAPPDWALRIGEVIELLTEARAESNWQLVSEATALLENMQAELVNELMECE